MPVTTSGRCHCLMVAVVPRVARSLQLVSSLSRAPRTPPPPAGAVSARARAARHGHCRHSTSLWPQRRRTARPRRPSSRSMAPLSSPVLSSRAVRRRPRASAPSCLSPPRPSSSARRPSHSTRAPLFNPASRDLLSSPRSSLFPLSQLLRVLDAHEHGIAGGELVATVQNRDEYAINSE